MLKRYQVMINDWLADSVKMIAKKYDISFSEVIRACLCIQLMQGIQKCYPRHKTKQFNIDNEINNIIRKSSRNEPLPPETLHKFFSDLYFETRKALEFLDETQKREK